MLHHPPRGLHHTSHRPPRSPHIPGVGCRHERHRPEEPPPPTGPPRDRRGPRGRERDRGRRRDPRARRGIPLGRCRDRLVPRRRPPPRPIRAIRPMLPPPRPRRPGWAPPLPTGTARSAPTPNGAMPRPAEAWDAADDLVDRVLATLDAYADVGAALPRDTGARMRHAARPRTTRNPTFIRDDDVLDPKRPEGLVYFDREGTLPVLLGAFFVAPAGIDAPAPAGNLVVWHSHDPRCAAFNATPEAPCTETRRMLHVWTIDDAVLTRRTGEPSPSGYRSVRSPFGASIEQALSDASRRWRLEAARTRWDDGSMGPRTVVVVEDDDHIAELLELYLGQAGFGVERATTGDDGLALVARRQPALAIVDVGLPGTPRRARRVPRAPRPEPRADRHPHGPGRRDRPVVGLELGADDYVTKPFSPRELVARVKAILRRSEGPRDRRSRAFRSTDWRSTSRGTRSAVTANTIELAPREFALLAALVENRGIVLSAPAAARSRVGLRLVRRRADRRRPRRPAPPEAR